MKQAAYRGGIATLAAMLTFAQNPGLDRARELVRANRLEEAIAVYEGLLQERPGDPALKMNLAVARFKAGQYDAVIALCRQVLESRPEAGAARLFLGASYFQTRRYAEAIPVLEEVVASQPEERNGRLMLGEARLLTGDAAAAAQHLARLAPVLPHEPRVWYGLERAYHELAERSSREVEQMPESAEWHALVGDAAYRRGRHGLALHHYREALTRNPRLAGVTEGMAAVYRATGRAEWAAEVEQRAAGQSSPGSAAYQDARRYHALRAEAFARLSQLPASVQFHELRARESQDAARYRDAIEEWKKAEALAPDNIVVKQGLATSLLDNREFGAAAAILLELVRKRPESAELYLLAGKALAGAEDTGQALPLLQKAVQLDPASLAARAQLGETLIKAGRASEAIPHLRAALPEDGDGARHFQLSRALHAAGDVEGAKAALAEYKRLHDLAESARDKLEADYPVNRP